MWKLLILAVVFVNLAEAQRSFYASRVNVSKLLPRFRTNNTAPATTSTPAPASDSGNSLETRGGGEEDDANAASSTSLPPNLQGTLEEESFVHRVSNWPEQRQPFWFKNRNAILSMRNRNIDGNEPSQRAAGNIDENARPRFQSGFFGPNSSRFRNTAAETSQAGNSFAGGPQPRNFYSDDALYPEDPFISYLRRIYSSY